MKIGREAKKSAKIPYHDYSRGYFLRQEQQSGAASPSFLAS